MARKRRKKRTSAPSKTRSFNGKRYSLDRCSTTKGNAKKRAASLRKKGKNARVVATGKGHCVYSR